MKIEEVRLLTGDGMEKKLSETHRKMLDLRFKAATKQIKNHREIPQTRRDIARMKTVQRERELGIRQD
ncbi:MAG: 50S ribosomal protein L29 [Dehalococcoidia bacterium]|nr:50S ribosomal protein L29 [Dehalococcoidia bacterium]MCL2615387.1 50S ribosomal protein L29 [Dehalococcoidia bacterium]